MADKCDPIRLKLRDLEVQLKDSQPTPGDTHPPKPPPHLNGLIHEIARTRESLQACMESLRARQWTVTGEPFIGSREIDTAVMRFMKAHAIRAMSVAIASEGTLSGHRAYTWAESTYPITQPDTLFRIASVSKLFTCAAIDRLVAAGALSFGTPAFALLGIVGPLLTTQTADPDIGRITVLQLATRVGGLADGFGADLREIAGLLGQTLLPTRDQLCRYVYGEPLVARPGDAGPGGDGFYSNSAFTVLTSAVEKASKLPFLDYLRRNVLAPFGISDVHVGATAHSGRRPNEVFTYDDPGSAPSQLDLTPGAVANNAYGGQFLLENGEGSGGLIMSTGTVARCLSNHAVWNIGPREVGGRYGRLAGTGAAAICRPDGLDFAFAFNRYIDYAHYNVLVGQINAVLDFHTTFQARIRRLIFGLTRAARTFATILRGRWDFKG
jgi:CubicO group peptidase (beta-lactamase class C family)